MKDTLLLIDGNGIMHRAYHALPAFKTKSGIPTNAVYGFFSILNKTVTDFQPHYIIVSFDTPAPTFRKKLFKEYQSQRPKMEDDLSQQFPIVKEALNSAGIVYLEKEGYEADDVIGTISKTFADNDKKVLILSGDKDILQLVNEKIFVITPQIGFGRQIIYSPEEVEKRFGIKPEQIPDFKALTGDPSDNYKGAKGIGPKTAAKLLQKYHSLENIFTNLDNLEEKTRKILEASKENIYMSQKLAKIFTDVDLQIDMIKSKFNGFDKNLQDFFKKYEMYSLLHRIFGQKLSSGKSSEKKTENQKKKINQNQMSLF